MLKKLPLKSPHEGLDEIDAYEEHHYVVSKVSAKKSKDTIMIVVGTTSNDKDVNC